jgi:hypothetical protein
MNPWPQRCNASSIFVRLRMSSNGLGCSAAQVFRKTAAASFSSPPLYLAEPRFSSDDLCASDRQLPMSRESYISNRSYHVGRVEKNVSLLVLVSPIWRKSCLTLALCRTRATTPVLVSTHCPTRASDTAPRLSRSFT